LICVKDWAPACAGETEIFGKSKYPRGETPALASRSRQKAAEHLANTRVFSFFAAFPLCAAIIRSPDPGTPPRRLQSIPPFLQSAFLPLR
jgi:hypothetical protein